MKNKFKCQGTYDYIKDSDPEIPSGESMTVPDEALTINEILNRFTHGIAPNVTGDGYYSDTDDYDDIDPIINDLTDLDDIRSELQTTYEQVENAKKRKNEPAPKSVTDAKGNEAEGKQKEPASDAQ
nr:MAG: hypothetical protein [Microviridae sp.]